MVTQIQRADVNIDGDNSIDEWEWRLYTAGRNPNEEYALDIDGRVIRGRLSEITSRLAGEFARAGSNNGPQDIATLLSQLNGKMTTSLNEIAQARQAGDAAKLAQLQQDMKRMIAEAEKIGRVLKVDIPDLAGFKQAAGMGGDGFKAVTISEPQSSGSPSGGYRAQGSGGLPQAGVPFSPPVGWAAQTANPIFNSSAYLQSITLEDNILSSWDAINESTNRGKQLMLLFFYFAKMAESGDMGAMYQFMKFITYIISKDKAKQQIEMGKKLIELQELSRKWTEKLMNLQTNANDPNSSNELMKTMTIVKSETDAIATSQKLISQMMEEFAQVVETLTNTTKAALETTGRVLRTVSAIRG